MFFKNVEKRQSLIFADNILDVDTEKDFLLKRTMWNQREMKKTISFGKKE